MLPAPSTADLATFTGRSAGSYSAFVTQALAQATLLFSIITKLTEYPDDDDAEQLARNAIMEMADRIYLEQPYMTYKASPFQSETIGSYSYAKGSTVALARDGIPTGLFWWELALDELSQADRSLVETGSVSALERDIYEDTDNNRWVLNPAEVAETPGVGGWDNLELSPRPHLG